MDDGLSYTLIRKDNVWRGLSHSQASRMFAEGGGIILLDEEYEPWKSREMEKLLLAAGIFESRTGDKVTILWKKRGEEKYEPSYPGC